MPVTVDTRANTRASTRANTRKDVRANAGRDAVLSAFGIDAPGIDALHWEEWRRCRDDILYWIDRYVMTYDPRLDGERWVPFKLWDSQVGLVKWIDGRVKAKAEGVIEKSRDQGVSWIVVAYAAHKCVFFRDTTIGFGAALEKQVDETDNPLSLFWKLRSLLDRLPKWQLPYGYDQKQMVVRVRHTDSVVTGQVGDNIGRGGRSSVYFIDEFAQVQHSQMVYEAVFGNTDTLIMLSTPNGVGNKFQQKRDGAPEDAVYTIHWTSDPRKTQAWADKKKEDDPVAFAKEYDLDYAASLDNITIPGQWVRAAIGYEIDPVVLAQSFFCGGLDFGTGRLSTVVTVRRGPKVKGQVLIDEQSIPKAVSAAIDAIDNAEGPNGERVEAVAFDASGDVGHEASKEVRKYSPSFSMVPILGQKGASNKILPDGKWAKDKFLNIRAEAWWDVRERCRKTYENVHEGADHPHSECISIPNDLVLIKELSTPLYFLTENGKIRVESKLAMRARGVKSPNRADSLVLSFLATRPLQRGSGMFSGYKRDNAHLAH